MPNDEVISIEIGEFPLTHPIEVCLIPDLIEIRRQRPNFGLTVVPNNGNRSRDARNSKINRVAIGTNSSRSTARLSPVYDTNACLPAEEGRQECPAKFHLGEFLKQATHKH